MTTVIQLPTSLALGSFEMSSQRFDLEMESDVTGYADTTIFGHPRWRVSLSAMQELSLAESSTWESISMRMRGKTNRLAVADPMRLAPRGTARGTVTLTADIAAGVYSAPISAGAPQAGKTFLTGDLLQIGTGMGTSQLVKLTEDLTLDGAGAGTINFEPHTRTAFLNTTTVVWDSPVAYYRLLGTQPGWNYATNAPLVNGFSFDLLEMWQ